MAILCYTDIYLPPTPSYANIIVIAILVTASTLLDFFEEYRSNKAAEQLKGNGCYHNLCNKKW